MWPRHAGGHGGLAKIIEEGIRFPGFAFINVQSPCVTYGLEHQQLKAHKAAMQSLESLGHDPSDRAKATELARAYGQNCTRACSIATRIRRQPMARAWPSAQRTLSKQAVPRHEILNRFKPGR